MARLLLLLVLFFASGVAALTYEVVWIRLLSLTLSITVYSLTTVLCAFMAGLALGAWLSSRFADRMARPLLAFGIAEFGIALCGVLGPVVLSNLGPVYLWLHDFAGGSGPAFDGARFGLAFVALLVPTTLMGVTLPLLSRAVIDRGDVIGRRAGALYAANTLGAVVGCVAAGFVLIPAFGLQLTSTLAASLNLAIGAGALAMAGRFAVPAVSRAENLRRPRPSAAVRVAAFAFGVSGFTAMGYEVLWTRALEHYTHNSTYAYTAMLGTFLVGLALGSAAASRVADRVARPLLAVGIAQFGVAAAVVLSLRIYIGFENLVPAVAERIGGLSSWGQVVVLMFTEAGLTMFATTLLLGAMFPLVARVAVESLDAVGQRIGMVYVWNTLGSILGSLIVGFGLLPWLGMRGAFLALVGGNLAAGALVLARERGRGPGLVAAPAALVVAFLALPPGLFEAQFVARFGDLLFYREEVTDTVMVTEDEKGVRMIRYSDGRGTAGTGTVIGDRMYGHLPLMLHPDPHDVLQICFGVGNSLSSVLQHPVKHVDAVELSPGVIDAAPFFEETNRDALSDPRVDLVINDGRNFLLTSRDLYDVIRLDPPELHTAGVVNLYTREFYVLARDRLAPGGIFSIWINNVMTPEPEIRMLLRTVADVFPHVSVWHDPKMFSWIINGSMESHDPDLEVLERRFADPKVRADLASIGIEDPFHFLNHYVFSGAELLAWAGDGPLVMDDHTRLDFSVPRSKESFFGIGNLNTDMYLIQYLEPGRTTDAVSFGIFARKVARLAGYKKPVLPVIARVDASGLSRAELEALLEDGRTKILIH
jgi:predicted membrane-bound spermidine synthase